MISVVSWSFVIVLGLVLFILGLIFRLSKIDLTRWIYFVKQKNFVRSLKLAGVFYMIIGVILWVMEM